MGERASRLYRCDTIEGLRERDTEEEGRGRPSSWSYGRGDLSITRRAVAAYH